VIGRIDGIEVGLTIISRLSKIRNWILRIELAMSNVHVLCFKNELLAFIRFLNVGASKVCSITIMGTNISLFSLYS